MPIPSLPLRSADFIDRGYDRQPFYTVGLTNTRAVPDTTAACHEIVVVHDAAPPAWQGFGDAPMLPVIGGSTATALTTALARRTPVTLSV